MSDHIITERRGAVQVIRFNRAEKKNAFTRAMYAAMAAALTSGDADDAVRAHVFLGTPGAFSAGNDLGDFLAVATGGAHGGEVMDFLLALATAAKPVLAGVDGLAIGIGTTIHFHCDLTFATPASSFRTPFVDLGLVPEAGSSLAAPRIMGHQRAFALLGLGEAFSAAMAVEAGFVRAVIDEDKLEETVIAAAQTLAAKPREALKIARDLVRGPREDVVARIREESKLFAERLRSDEARAAFMAFMAKKG